MKLTTLFAVTFAAFASAAAVSQPEDKYGNLDKRLLSMAAPEQLHHSRDR